MPSANFCNKYFKCHVSSYTQILLFPPFNRERCWEAGNWSNLPKSQACKWWHLLSNGSQPLCYIVPYMVAGDEQNHKWRVSSRRQNETSLVALWLRIRLPTQGTRVRALVREDPTCRRATKPVRHNYWACALELVSHNYWACAPRARAPQQEKPPKWEPCSPQWRLAPARHN